MGGHITDCPDVSHYMADQIENKHDSQAFAVVVQETLQCMFGGDQRMLMAAQTTAAGRGDAGVECGGLEQQLYLPPIGRRCCVPWLENPANESCYWPRRDF